MAIRLSGLYFLFLAAVVQKLKSRRINYEVIDELFGEAASNGF